MKINLTRFQKRFNEMSKIGSLESGGISRLTLSDSDLKARDLFVQWLKDINLNIRIDDVGNIYGRKVGTDPTAKPIVFGSHLDSIENGGIFDGILGIIVGLEIIQTLSEHDISIRNPIEVVNFTNEEGVRFKSLMGGSGVLSGDYNIQDIYSEQDDQGNTFYDELKSIGYLGNKENRLTDAEAFIELHIEQGPILDTEQIPIGIVEAMLGFKWLTVNVKGESNSAGPTPMNLRKDALKSAAKMITEIELITKELGENVSSTIGNLKVEPGYVNSIPGEVNFTLDIRERSQDRLNDAMDIIEQSINNIANEDKVKVQIKEDKLFEPIDFSKKICNVMEEEANKLNYPSKRLISGAGHISTFMNKLIPTAIMFVPSIGGISHSPEENTAWDDINKASNTLLYTVLQLAK